MPPKKVPKEVVQYPASKRKAPPFKPQRPSQRPRVEDATQDEAPSRNVGRTNSAVSRTSSAGLTAEKTTGVQRTASGSGFAPAGSGMFARAGASSAAAKAKARTVVGDDEEEEVTKTASPASSDNDDSDELDDDPLVVRPSKQPPQVLARRRPTAPARPALNVSDDDDENEGDAQPTTATKKRATAPARRQISPLNVSSRDEAGPLSPPSQAAADAPVPSQSTSIPSIPRQLLLRLMHEHFASKQTKIDKHAVAVLEKYFEVFIRETIARTALAKKEDVRMGNASQSDEKWLEKSDLEKVVAGVVMDF